MFIYHEVALGQSHEYVSLGEKKGAPMVDWSVLRVYSLVCLVTLFGLVAHIVDANNPANFEKGGSTTGNMPHSH